MQTDDNALQTKEDNRELGAYPIEVEYGVPLWIQADAGAAHLQFGD